MAKSKTQYVDGFVLVVPKKNRTAYKKMATEAKGIWLSYGALDYKECLIDDAKPKHITFTFAKMTKVKKNEDVWFSYITYRNKKHRNAVNKKIDAHMSEKYKDAKMSDMPFDMKRTAFAGFNVIVG
ncbi:DUF1428 domain-containing protein [Patescibacteria group bacterium]|nr:DUF1428 domain-containing protein [Patescibacteria group bacterium]